MLNSPTEYAYFILVLLLAYTIRGITGFGSGLIAVPLLAQIFPLQMIVPLILLTDFSASILLGFHIRKDVRWDELRFLLPFGVLGVLVGATLLVNLQHTLLLTLLGVIILIFGVRDVLNIQNTTTVSKAWAIPAGLIGGTISALFGTGGPPYVIYLKHRISRIAELRATFSGLFLVEGFGRIIVFIIAGLLIDIDLVRPIVIALPLVVIGLWAGHIFHYKVKQSNMQRLIGGLLLVSALALLYRALGR